MSEPVIFPVPPVEVRMNGQLLGMTQRVELRVETEPVEVRSFGKRDPVAVVDGKRVYTVTLRRLLLDRADFPNQPSASGLSSFSLSLSDSVMETTFTDCRVVKESAVCEAGGVLIEALEIRATGRTMNNLS